MAFGGGKTQRIDITDSYDPRVEGRAAQKGTVFRYIPDSGTPEVLIKEDAGFSTNWIPLGQSPEIPITTAAAASTANVDVAVAPANLDGVALTAGDLVLLKDQTLPEENGVYTFDVAGDPLVRAEGWDTANEFIPGRQVFVNEGTDNEDTLWVLADYVPVLGTDPVTFIPVVAQVIFPASSLTQTIYVNKGGSDALGDGSIYKPYLTNKFALDQISDASTTKKYQILVGPGIYAEVAAYIKANVFIVATSAELTQITNTIPWDLDAGFSGGDVNQSGFIGVQLADVVNIDFATATSTHSQFLFLRCILNGVVNITAGGNLNEVDFIDTETTDALNIDASTVSFYGHKGETGLMTITNTPNLLCTVIGYSGLVNNGITVTGDGVGRITLELFGMVVYGGLTATGANVFVTAKQDALDTTAPAVSAGASLTLASNAVNDGYTPAVAANWANLPSEVASALDEASRRLALPVNPLNGGVIDFELKGASAGGTSDGAGSTIDASAIGAQAFGSTLASGTIIASNEGAEAGGVASTGAATITASGLGSIAKGQAANGATIIASAGASLALGVASGANANILAAQSGAIAGGYTQNGGEIIARGIGAFSHGFNQANGNISADGAGSFANGYNDATGSISATNSGCAAFGSTVSSGIISATNLGAMAHGHCFGGGSVLATGIGSTAFGRAQLTAMTVSGQGSMGGGSCFSSPFTISGEGSFGWGVTTGADPITEFNITGRGCIGVGGSIFIISNWSQSFGLGAANDSFASMSIGIFPEYGVGAPSPITAVPTDPAFRIGNGTSTNARSNALRVDKDGMMINAGGHRNTRIITLAAAGVITNRDYKVILDSNGATGNIDLPAGVEGLELIFTVSGGGAAVYTLVPNGVETLDAGITAALTTTNRVQRIFFSGTTWYAE